MFASLAAIALTLAACSGDELRDDDGVVINPGEASVFELRPGDCLETPPDLTGEVDEVDLVPCEEPHTQEVFALVTHPEDSYPGVDEVAAFADGECLNELEAELDLTLDDGVFISYLLPTFDGWSTGEDREITCVLVFPDRDEMTGSFVAGTATVEPLPPAEPQLPDDDGDDEVVEDPDPDEGGSAAPGDAASADGGRRGLDG